MREYKYSAIMLGVRLLENQTMKREKTQAQAAMAQAITQVQILKVNMSLLVNSKISPIVFC